MKEVLEKFKDKRILIVGDICLDRDRTVDIVQGSSREADIPTLRHVKGKEGHSEGYSGGGGANLAENLTSLGAKVTVLGVIGKDHHGDILKNELEKRGVDTQYLISDENRATIVFERSYDVKNPTKPIGRWDVENSFALTEEIQNKIIDNLISLAENHDAIVVMDHCEVDESTAIINDRILETLANLKNKIKIFGTSRNRTEKFQDFYCITPNDNESVRATKLYEPKNFEEEIPENITLQAGNLLHKNSRSNIVMTVGKNGVNLFNQEGHKQIPTKPLEGEIDTCGCGDTFLATLTLADISGAKIEDAIKLANLSAGLTAKKIGTTGNSTTEDLLKLI